jgi:hypothetical protein
MTQEGCVCGWCGRHNYPRNRKAMDVNQLHCSGLGCCGSACFTGQPPCSTEMAFGLAFHSLAAGAKPDLSLPDCAAPFRVHHKTPSASGETADPSGQIVVYQ